MQAKRFLLPILMLWLLAGCSMPSLTKPSKPAQPTDPAILESRGEYEAAAGLLTQMAEGRKPPEQQQLQLRAADDLLRAKRLDEAQALLDRTATAGLGELDLQRRIQLAEIQLARSNPGGAMQQLPQRLPPSAPLELARRYYGARAEAQRQSGKILEAVGELSELDGILTDQQERLENQKRILQLLMPLAESSLELLQPKPPGTLGGWMELVRLMKANAGQTARLQAQVTQWRKRFPSHPALPNLIDQYYGRASAAVVAQAGNRIAVLLPESGALAKAGDALRDGMMAAWTQQPAESRPQLMFYDSGPFEQIAPLYQQAVKDGARMVVGPLAKEQVSQLVGAGSLPLPTLVLNQVDSAQPVPASLYQFGLSPEDEARQVAEGAWRDGQRVALVLSPDNDWGARVYNAFAQRWRQLGGIVAEHQRYAPDSHDFATPVKALMNLDDSVARHQEMQRTLGKNLGFDPQARGDAQFIFMIAKAAQARQIRPQFQYANAGGMPIYATSAVYAGDPNAQRDQDLNGVRFPEVPWLLHFDPQDPLSQNQVATVLPESRGDFRRLFAMGMDAFTLAVNLPRLTDRRGETLEGRTGLLHLGEQNRIERRMEWAQIESGLPRPLGSVPAVDGARPAPIPMGGPIPAAAAAGSVPATQPAAPPPQVR